jgi:glycosyltransferase involved in cell wall biosynthesis
MSAPLVSIALCTYNGAKYLRQQMDTLVAQTYSNLEIIAVDDGSSDETVSILEEYTERYKNISIHINETNLGYIRNFEKAIGLCKGEYIALCDQDDIWDPKKISLMMEHIGNHMLIYHDSAFIDDDGNSLNRKLSDIRNCYSGADPRVFLFENCVSGHAMLFRKELMNYADGFKLKIIHDWWLAYAATNVGSIFFLDQALVQYRQHRTTSTDILRQKKHLIKYEGSIEKLEKQLIILRLFSSYPFNKCSDFNNSILRLMERRIHAWFSFSLFWLMFKNRKVLLYIQRKSALSKFNFILKFMWGYKIKRLFQSV